MSEFSQAQQIVLGIVPVIFAITVHEVAHGWVANRLGDPTARILGRLTLNPIRHVDPVGTVIVPLFMALTTHFVFGWARPVPVDWRNLRRPKRDMALVAAAGPAANLFMFLLWVLVAKAALLMQDAFGGLAAALAFMAWVGFSINATLMVLNLLPVPPLDGSRVLSAILPPHLSVRFNRLDRYGLLIVVLLLVSGVLGRILQPLLGMMNALAQSLLRAG